MEQWGARHQVMFISQRGEHKTELSSRTPKEEGVKDEEVVKAANAKTLFMPEFKKRKRRSCGQPWELKAAISGKQRQCNSKDKKKKLEGTTDRWPTERYNLSEESLLKILKSVGATFTNPITRPDLRVAARKHIGDTGLLDHLLKHIDGKVAPGGTERFRRWFNTEGIMEYWLESVDMDSIREDAGVQDPYRIPSSRSMSGGGPSQDNSSGEMRLLKEEMIKMGRDMKELISKKLDPSETNLMEETHKELVKWKVMTEQRLSEITTSLKSMQGMYGELEKWKAKIEQQILELTNSLNNLQTTKEYTAHSPEKLEDWLATSNLIDIQDDDFLSWFGNDLQDVGQEVAVQDPNLAPPTQSTACVVPSQDPICMRELQLLKEEMVSLKSKVLELVPKKQEEDQANVTPDSCITVNSKLDVDNSLILFQEMFMELFKWKDKMEQQLFDVSNSMYSMLAMKYQTPPNY
ncbi:Protein DYAD [Quillaja saponaria]|uniref:Protein DYAD n=1 Tax=Quillaja saponaria TaxID=32244 RepID=A0AAD7KSY1_QUISA|nr:Protein DYAD [Quillaja saponaria]